MAKAYSRYVCQVCGKVSSQSFGRCPACDSWDSMVEEVVEPEVSHSARAVRGLATPSRAWPKLKAKTRGTRAGAHAGICRRCWAGIVPGSVVLIGGDPGIGKSALTLPMAMELAGQNVVLYVSGEDRNAR